MSKSVLPYIFLSLSLFLLGVPLAAQGVTPSSGGSQNPRYGLDFEASGIVAGASPLQGLTPPDPNLLVADKGRPPLPSSPTFSYLGARMNVGGGGKDLWLRLGATLGFKGTGSSSKTEGITTTTISTSIFSIGLSPGMEIPLAKSRRVELSFVGFLPFGFSSIGSSIKTEATIGNQTLSLEVKRDFTAFWFGLSPGVGASVELLDNFYLGSEYRFLILFSSLSGKDSSGSEFGFFPINFNFLLSYRF